MDKVAVVTSRLDRLEDDSLLTQLEKYVDPKGIQDCVRLSSQGSHLDLNLGNAKPANVYTPLNSEFKQTFVLKDECSRLVANNLTVCWLAQLLLDMGKGSALYLEMSSRQVVSHPSRVSLELLKSKLPRVQCEVLDSEWVRLGWTPELSHDKEQLKTTYKYLHGSFGEFWEAWSGVFASDDENFAEAVKQFIYGIRGANSKGYVTSVILREYFGDTRIHGLDLGGRSGFMAAEIAAEGHTMTVLDIDAKYIELGAWIQEKCQLASRVNLGVADTREIDSLEGEYGMIGFYETLPGVGKEYAPKIFRECMRLLTRGGLIVVQEGSFQAGRDQSDPWRERVFTLDELVRNLTENAGEPMFYHRGSAQRVAREDLREDKNGVVAVVRKR